MPQLDKDKLKQLVGELFGINDIIDQLQLDINQDFIPESACDTPSVEIAEDELPCEKPLTSDEKQELIDKLPTFDVPTFDSFPFPCSDECIQNLTTSTKIASNKVFDNLNSYSENIIPALSAFFRSYILFKYELSLYYYYATIYDNNLLKNIKIDDIQQYINSIEYDNNSIIDSIFKNINLLLDSYEKIQINKAYYSTLISTEFVSRIFQKDVKLAIDTVFTTIDKNYTMEGADSIYDFKYTGKSYTGMIKEFDLILKREPTDDELKDIDSYFLNVENSSKNLSNSVMATGFQALIYYKSVFLLYNSGQISNFHKKFMKTKTAILNNLNYLVDLVSKKDIKKNKQIVIDSIQITCCGKLIQIDETPAKETSDDLNNNSFQKSGNPELTDLNYWKKYASQLTLVNLNPMYWTIGVIIGPTRIPLPTIWTAIHCFHTPFNIIVIFLTINGLVVCPVIWILNMKPIADNQSMLLVLFRGAMQQIKNGTNCEALYQTIASDIDIAPDISIKSPFKTDDLPTYERLSIANLPYIAYLDKWLKTAKNFMGL